MHNTDLVKRKAFLVIRIKLQTFSNFSEKKIIWTHFKTTSSKAFKFNFTWKIISRDPHHPQVSTSKTTGKK